MLEFSEKDQNADITMVKKVKENMLIIYEVVKKKIEIENKW